MENIVGLGKHWFKVWAGMGDLERKKNGQTLLFLRTINLRTGHVYCYIHVYTHMRNVSYNPRGAHGSEVFPRQKDLFLQIDLLLWLLLLFFSGDKDVLILDHIFLYTEVKSHPGKVIKIRSNRQEVIIWLKNQVWQIQHYVYEQEKRPQRPFHRSTFSGIILLQEHHDHGETDRFLLSSL